jgi:hypothetical protein
MVDLRKGGRRGERRDRQGHYNRCREKGRAHLKRVDSGGVAHETLRHGYGVSGLFINITIFKARAYSKLFYVVKVAIL